MNLLGESEARVYLNRRLSARGLPQDISLRLGLGDLGLEEFLGVGAFGEVRDEVARIDDDAFVNFVPPGWQPGGERLSDATVDASHFKIFVRRAVFGWGALLLLDDSWPERQLLFETRGARVGGYPPDAGRRPVVRIGFFGNLASSFSLIRTHCGYQGGCSSKSGGCTCSLVPVVTGDGDDAWACWCNRHGSA